VTILELNVSRDAIDASVRAARHPGHEPARWALPLVAEADRTSGGAWTLVEFDEAEASALWLPPHAGEPCHGDTLPLGRDRTPSESVAEEEPPWPGLSLRDAAAWLRDHARLYAAGNPSCWARIVAARDTSWGPIVVAPFPVGDRTAPPGTPLIAIDGLHRVMGWALRERHGDDAHTPTLLAYLAGPATREGR
jgi:hypothetical protein